MEVLNEGYNAMKKCSKCGEFKELKDFHKNKSSKIGVMSICKPCHCSEVRDWANSDRGKKIKANANLLYLYGITLDEYNLKFYEQNGRCAICGKTQEGRRLYVDHNHKTKDVRGLLCNKCNSAIGYFHENTAILISAIKYLNKYNRFI